MVQLEDTTYADLASRAEKSDGLERENLERQPRARRSAELQSEEERVEIKIIPAQITLLKHVRAKYACRQCQKNADKTPVLAAPIPPTAFPGSLASASAVAHIMHEKYVMGSPLYRQEAEFERMG